MIYKYIFIKIVIMNINFQTLPINYTEYTETVAIKITESVSQDLLNATGDVTL